MPKKMFFPVTTCTSCAQELEAPKTNKIVWANRPDGTKVGTAYCPKCYFPYILVDTQPNPAKT